jgi:hypothetical protein
MRARARALVWSPAATLAIALSLASTAPAVAAVVTKVTFKIEDGHLFKGRVLSGVDACVVGREVRLIRIEPDGSRTRLETTFATESGHWFVSVPMQSGNRFFARVPRVETPPGAVCRGDRSRTRTV